jgi:transcriptional pleiotropic regulator of transition state genes
MKATGVVRKVDELGRVVLPIEIRRTHSIDEGTPVEIFIDGNNIILKKYQPTCAVCSESDNLVDSLANHGIKICRKCLKEARV